MPLQKNELRSVYADALFRSRFPATIHVPRVYNGILGDTSKNEVFGNFFPSQYMFAEFAENLVFSIGYCIKIAQGSKKPKAKIAEPKWEGTVRNHYIESFCACLSDIDLPPEQL